MSRAMEKYLRPGLKGTPFCPGCGHGILMNALLRAIDGLQMDMEKMVFVSGIGGAAWEVLFERFAATAPQVISPNKANAKTYEKLAKDFTARLKDAYGL